MKNLNFLSRALVAMVTLFPIGISAFAHDFEVDGIYYNITDVTNKNVEVTYQGDSYSSYSNGYSGSVSIPNSVTYNGITYSVTKISQEAFEDCYGLTEVTIPNSVTMIGDYAFRGCRLVSVTSYCETPPTCGSFAFYGSYSALLNVPEGTKDTYANADEWEKFTNINENSGVDGVGTEGNAIEVARYDIHGRLLTQPAEGINIVKMSDGTTRKEMVK